MVSCFYAVIIIFDEGKQLVQERTVLVVGYIVAALDEARDCAHFTWEGMEGAQRKNPQRPVSLMSLASRQAVDQAEQRGLCYARFTADITLDCAQMPPQGARIGNGLVAFNILPEGKQCWPECSLFQNKLPCPLVEGVRYARVDSPGRLCLGDCLSETHGAKDLTSG